METYTLSAFSVPCESWDVVVVGGGPAGCAAAIASAREGARTLLVEQTGCLGGMGTAALVPCWAPYSDGEKIIYRGLAEKIFAAAGRHVPHARKGELDWVPISIEHLKGIYDREVAGSGAKVLLHTHFSRVMAADGRVEAVILGNKSGMTACRAKVFIDTTGDADLCARAGAEFHKGDARGSSLMPATLCFVLSNVDTYAYLNGPELHPKNPGSVIYKIVQSGRYPLIPDVHLCSNLIGPGTVGFNAGHIWVDGTDAGALSEAMMRGREMAACYRDALAEHFPAAFANAYLVSTGNLPGIRETRRVVGDYVLTLSDYLQRRKFPDEISRNSYFIDIHFARERAASSPDELKTWDSTTMRYGLGESHGIPYRCLTPKSFKNLLVAGRCISCDQQVQGSVRIMPIAFTTGEAAGVAAALAMASGDNDVHAVDTGKLRRRLIELGAHLPAPEAG